VRVEDSQIHDEEKAGCKTLMHLGRKRRKQARELTTPRYTVKTRQGVKHSCTWKKTIRKREWKKDGP